MARRRRVVLVRAVAGLQGARRRQASMTGDRARVSVAVAVDAPTAFDIFTREIDQWWRRGARFRNAGARRGVVCIEPHVGGRLFESIEGKVASHVVEIGRVSVW